MMAQHPTRSVRILAALAMAVLGCPGTSARASLLAYYPFDKDFTDASGNHNDLTVANGTPVITTTAGEYVFGGGALDVHSTVSTAEYLNLTTPIKFGDHDAWSIAFWARRRPGTDDRKGMVIGDTSNSNDFIWVPNNSAQVQGLRWRSSTNTNANFGGFPDDHQFHHWVVVYDGVGTVLAYRDNVLQPPVAVTGSFSITSVAHAYNATTQSMDGQIDELYVYNEAINAATVDSLYHFAPELASAPKPSDKETEVPADVILGWKPGDSAQAHDVYLGTIFADVNSAGRTDPRGVLVSQNQSGTAYAPSGHLVLGTTYYWRIDELDTPAATPHRGRVWSFTTESVAYPVDGQTITVTASSAVAGQGPENTANGSGLTNDLHGNDLTTMWLTAADATGPAWIQYEFAQPIQLHEMWVWNHNGLMESMLGLGAKDVTIAYSLDGTSFQTLGTTHQFARATSQPNYTHNTVVDFGNVAAKYVKLTLQSNWGNVLPQYGLSEVRFLAVPVYAREPSPAPGTTNLAPHVTMSWRPGREAGSHQVFLGTDPNQLALAATVPQAAYDTDLNLGQTYYWKIAEINQAKVPATWTGDVWSFSTVKALVVEDFESYTDEDGKAIWQTWIDGYGTTTNGSQVGNVNPPYAERTFIHSGTQAMPLFYDNTAGATYSEATRTFDSPQDWTQYGIKALTLYFLGDPNNTVGNLYVKINSTKVLYNGAAADIQSKPWQMWYIDLSSLAGVNLKQVTKLTIGLESGKGVLYLDDLALSPRSREMVTPVQPAATNLLVRYAFEGNLNDSVAARNLTATGTLQYTAGHLGQAVLLNGTSDFVSAAASLDLPVYTAGVWFRVNGGTGSRDVLSIYNGSGGFGVSAEIGSNGVLRFLHRFPLGSSGGTSIYSTFSCADGTWCHAAFVKTPDTMTLYINGLPAGSATDKTQFDTPLARLTLGVLRHDNLQRFFPGAIDEVTLYNRVLSEAEIAALAGRTTPFTKPF